MTVTRRNGALAIWSLGPGSYCATWVLCLAQPWVCDPNPCLAILLILLHVATGIAVLFALGASAAFRRSAAMWLVFAYFAWWAVFGAIAIAWLGDNETRLPEWLPGFGRWTFRGTLVLAIASGVGLLVPSSLLRSVHDPARSDTIAKR